jgi:porin
MTKKKGLGIVLAGFAGFMAAAVQGQPLTAEDIEFAVSAAGIYQRNVKGGISTNDRKGEFSGSYDVELLLNLERLTGFDGTIFVHGEGGWTDAEGIDGRTVGSVFGINTDAIGNRSLDIVELFYEVPLNEVLTLTVGKIDFTGFFDAGAYANDEASQFLNGALVNNPGIPFPDYSLGVILSWAITDNWYLMGGIADAQADGRETGFRTAFGGEDYFFSILETGLTASLPSNNGDLIGTYRAGVWYDPQPKANADRLQEGKSYRDDTGWYLSFDQMLAKENADPADTQGLGGFFRYGYAPSRSNDITQFYSFGVQYQGLFDGRDDDVLGIGYAHGVFSDTADTTYTSDYESVLEVYYSAQVADWLNLSPSMQYVANPGGDRTVGDAVVLGVRALVTF